MKKLIFIAVATVMSASSAFAQQIVIPSITAPTVQAQVNNNTQVPVAAAVSLFGSNSTATATADNTTRQRIDNTQTFNNFGLGLGF